MTPNPAHLAVLPRSTRLYIDMSALEALRGPVREIYT